jgi:hypothetical protein
VTSQISSTGPKAKREPEMIEEVTYGCNWLCFKCCKSTQMIPKPTSIEAEKYIAVSYKPTHQRERTWGMIGNKMTYRSDEPKEEEKKSPEKVIKSVEIVKSDTGSKEIRELTTTISPDGVSSTTLRISFEK